MINNPIVFNQEQLDIIAGIKAKVNFNSESWMCDEVEILRPIIRQYYAIEQNSTCPYCRMQLNTQRGRTWDVEHIIPRSAVENFMFEPLNLCVACVECNSAKSNKSVTTSKARKIYPEKVSTPPNPLPGLENHNCHPQHSPSTIQTLLKSSSF